MGIQGLTKLLADHAPGSIREQKYENYFGRKIAVDASMHIYSFLAVVGRTGDQLLQTESGEITSHILGMFYRCCRMLEAGMRPIFVFEGKAPDLKREELAKRAARRHGANTELQAAIEAGNQEDVEKYAKRTIRVTREHNEDCKRLLRLMGVPVVDAPSEAEAQCAQLCKDGVVYGISTEDMDALTFGTPRLLRDLMAPASKDVPVREIDYQKVLELLELTPDEFIDFCILSGCDYTEKIGGVGPVRALQLVQKHKSIEKILESLDPEKYKIPDPFPYQEARRLFKEPDVVKADALGTALKWTDPDEEGLVAFLVGEKEFDETRVRGAIGRVKKSKGKASQGRMESFFGPAKIVSSSGGVKRKEPEQKKKGGGGKKGKLGGVGGRK